MRLQEEVRAESLQVQCSLPYHLAADRREAGFVMVVVGLALVPEGGLPSSTPPENGVLRTSATPVEILRSIGPAPIDAAGGLPADQGCPHAR
jgi:hypothetical protein